MWITTYLWMLKIEILLHVYWFEILIFKETVDFSSVELTDLRFDYNYVLWYNNITKLLTSGNLFLRSFSSYFFTQNKALFSVLFLLLCCSPANNSYLLCSSLVLFFVENICNFASLQVYSHGQWLFNKFVSKITNKLVK